MFCLTNEPKSQGSRAPSLSFANPMDDMAAINGYLINLLFGNAIDCSSCVADLKRNKCIGYMLLEMISEAIISLDVAMYIFST